MSKKINSIEKCVGLLYDSVSSNTGDIAIGLALSQALGKRGVKTKILDPYTYINNPNETIIVGGGQLLRDPGDDFYDKFRVKGKHILNSIGVSGTKDLGYLSDYLYLSTRSNYESNIVKKHTSSVVHTIPCTTTLLESEKYTIPGLDIKSSDKLVGIHIIPDVMMMCPDIIQIINKIPHKKVFIPFTHYNHDASFMKNLPFDKSNAIVLEKLKPLELHSVISQMNYVIVSSLHASIFAYSQNIPFISMHQKKVYDYFKDRGLDKYIYRNQKQLIGLINFIENNEINMSNQIQKDKKNANKAVDKYAEIIKLSTTNVKKPSTSSDVESSRVYRQKLEIKQLEGVIEKRDVLIHNMVYENMRSLEATANSLNDKIRELENKLKTEKERIIPYRVKSKLNKIIGKNTK